MIMKYVIVRRNVNCDDHLEKSVINIFVSKDRESTKNRNAFLRWCLELGALVCLLSLLFIWIYRSQICPYVHTALTYELFAWPKLNCPSVHLPSRGENYSVPSSRSIRRCLMFMKSPPRTDLAGMRNRYPPCLSVYKQQYYIHRKRPGHYPI